MTDMNRRILLTLGLGAAMLAGCGDDDSGTTDDDMGVEADADVTPDMPIVPSDMGQPITECTAESMGSTIGGTCLRDADCSDACFCNGVELCMEGVCVIGTEPCGRTECSAGTCDEASRTCDETPDDSLCDDGVFCNGAETCDPERGCRPGVPPFCGDGDICTVDFCDEDASMCTHLILDDDMDGEASRRCGGNDCDDSNPNRYPGNTEVCDNGVDDDCNNLVDGFDAACAPPNDRCTDGGDGRGPLDITRATDGTSIIATSTVAMDGDYNTTCGETTEDAGPDAVFSFTLADPKDVSVEVQGIDNDAIISLRTLAACETEANDIRCSDTNTGVQPFVKANSLPAGDYAIIVITENETAFDLAFTVEPPTVLSLDADSCDTTTIDVSAGGTFTGNFVGDPRYEGDEFDDTYELPCRPTTAAYKDVAFTLSIPAGEFRDVLIEGYSSFGTSGRRPFVALVDDCSSPDEDIAQCSESPSNGAPATLNLRNLPGGDYFILLEADFTTDEGWQLDVAVNPPSGAEPGDSCFGTTPVDITSGSGMIDLSTLEHVPDEPAFCRTNGAGSTDAFFEFTLASESDVTIATTSSPAVRHTVAWSSTCGDVTTDFDCYTATGGSNSRLYQRLPAGTHYVNVTTLDTTGVITANLTVAAPTPAPGNNTCASAATIAPNTSVVIDLPDYDSNGDYCGEVGWLDAYYTFTLAADTSVSLRAQNARSIALLDGACDAMTPTCDDGTPPRIEQTLPAGTYYVVVEADPFVAQSDTQLFFSTF